MRECSVTIDDAAICHIFKRLSEYSPLIWVHEDFLNRICDLVRVAIFHFAPELHEQIVLALLL